jgi:hypothetical protein
MTAVQEFLSQRKLALVGASSQSRKFGNMILKDMMQKGYQLFPVHPTAAEIDGVKCYPALAAIPERMDGLVVCVPPLQTEKVVQEAVRIGIKNIWLQQGAESPVAIQFCQQNKANVVSGECIFMFAQPIRFPHKLHRWFWQLFGKLPKH